MRATFCPSTMNRVMTLCTSGGCAAQCRHAPSECVFFVQRPLPPSAEPWIRWRCLISRRGCSGGVQVHNLESWFLGVCQAVCAALSVQGRS